MTCVGVPSHVPQLLLGLAQSDPQLLLFTL